MPPRPRIAILGGGAGAVTAAVQLSKPGWQQRFESITLYQQGWRLGGKGACGRGQDLRIEEHGLHVWLGFYENAFRVLNRSHQELDALAEGPNGKPRWELPFASVADSFSPRNEITVTDHDGCGWKLWAADFFDEHDDRPWLEPDPRSPAERPEAWSVVFYATRCLLLASDLAASLARSDPELAIVAGPLSEAREAASGLGDAIDGLWDALGGDLRGLLGGAAEVLDSLAAAGFEQPLALDAFGIVVRALDAAVDLLRARADEVVRASDSVRRAYYVVDLMLAIVRGVIEDGVIEADSFAVIDDVDLRDWLLAHGAARESVECALIRAVVYDIAFAYEGGDPRRPACAAGTALRGMLRLFFTYRGSLMWKMNAGMGDVVFLPLYELLVKRGVEIRFFHRVEELRVANGAIDEIEIDVQAELPAGTTALSFVTPVGVATAAGGGGAPPPPKLSWPADPATILAGPGAVASAAGTSELPADAYESWYADRSQAQVETKVLRRGAADGFDLVVFGLPISCVPHVGAELISSSARWKDAVDHLRTVPTQAMQLWLDRPVTDLSDVDPGAIVSGYVEPFDTWADMPQLVSQERVEGSATVAYFCNVLADAAPPQRGQADPWLEAQKELVQAQALRFLTHDIAPLWPHAVDPITGQLDWQRLVAPPYLRANVEPSERYVLSVPGSGRHRIRPDDTGFANLYAVGDWTACELDAGCVEAAVISGILAANAIHRTHGDPTDAEPIVGEGGP